MNELNKELTAEATASSSEQIIEKAKDFSERLQKAVLAVDDKALELKLCEQLDPELKNLVQMYGELNLILDGKK